MTAERHVVVVERMRRRTVDPGRLRRRCPRAHKVEASIAGRRRQHLGQDLGWVLYAAGDHRADAIGKAGVHDAQGVGGNGGEPQLRDEGAEGAGERF